MHAFTFLPQFSINYTHSFGIVHSPTPIPSHPNPLLWDPPCCHSITWWSSPWWLSIPWFHTFTPRTNLQRVFIFYTNTIPSHSQNQHIGKLPFIPKHWYHNRTTPSRFKAKGHPSQHLCFQIVTCPLGNINPSFDASPLGGAASCRLSLNPTYTSLHSFILSMNTIWQ